MTCERHEWDHDELPARCRQCGALYPYSPQELYRIEKMRRGLPVQEYRRDGKPYRPRGGPTHCDCPQCRSEVIVLGRYVSRGARKMRWAHCCGCGYEWKTTSREAFGGTRQVEVRG